MLEDVLKSYRAKADVINWKKYSPNELFFECIKHENDHLYENYFAGIVCRFWGYAGRMYIKCNKHIPFEECHDTIIDSIQYVLKKRVWENPNSSLYNDSTGPDKAMHIAMKRQQSIVLSKYNAKRRLSNFNTLSLDAVQEEYKDASEGLLFGNDHNTDDHLKVFISEYFDNDDILNGVFLDTIAYSNEKYKEKNIVKHLKSLSFNDFNYFKNTYNVSEKDFKKFLYELNKMSTNYLLVKLNSLLYSLRREQIFND